MDVTKKLLGSKHSSLRNRMKEKQWPKQHHQQDSHAYDDDDGETKTKKKNGDDDDDDTSPPPTTASKVKAHQDRSILNHSHRMSPTVTITYPTLSAVVSVDEASMEGEDEELTSMTPGATKCRDDKSIHGNKTDTTSSHGDVTPDVDHKLLLSRETTEDYYDTTTAMTMKVTMRVTDQEPDETTNMTLIGQDYMSTPSRDANDSSLPLEAYDANAMQDILRDLGESFLNANSSLVQDDDIYHDNNNDNTNHSTTQNHTTHVYEDFTSTAATRDRGMDRSEEEYVKTLDDRNNNSDDVDDRLYPFPSGDSNIHQVMDSSLLQVSLTSEASSPSPTAPRQQWQAYKSRNAQLHDRNTSLIKEIRFAEQTCVELSQEKQYLERELNQAQKIIEEEFWSKKQLLEKLEHLAESHDLLEQQLEQERDYQDEIKLEIENVRQSKIELTQELEKERQNRQELVLAKSSDEQQHEDIPGDHPSNQINAAVEQLQQQNQMAKEREDMLQALLQQERDSKLVLQQKLETERQSTLHAEAQLQEERRNKTSLKTALQQALQHIEQQKQVHDAQQRGNDDELEMKWAMRIADLESKLAYAQQHNMPSPNSKLLMRIEELEAQNTYLKRQLPLKTDEPDGMAPIRPEKKPDAPNVARKLELEAQAEEDAVARREVMDLEATLKAVQHEYSEYKEREQQRLDSVRESFQQNQVQLTTQLTYLQDEKQRLEEELVRQHRITAEFNTWRTAAMQDSRRVEEELANERRVCMDLAEKIRALQQANQTDHRIEEDLMNQRRMNGELTEKLAALQKDYNRVGLSDQSLRVSLGDVKERLAHVENELAMAQRKSHSLEKQMESKDETFSQLQAEQQVLHDEFARVLKTAMLEMDDQAVAVEAVLLSKIEEYRLRVISLTSMVETLRSTLDFDFSEGNTDNSDYAHMCESDPSAAPDVTVLDATFRRNGVADESLLHEMEEARLPSKDEHDAMYLSEISHENSMSGWIKTMDISKLDDTAVIEVQKFQSSLGAAQNQIQSHLETIGVLEQEIDKLERNRQYDSAKIHDLENVISTSNSKISELQVKLKAAERSFIAVEDVQRELQAAQEQVRNLENCAKTNEAKLMDLQLASSDAEHLRHALSEAEAEIERLQVAFVTCNDRLAGAFEAMANNEDLIGKFKESTDEAVKISIEAASSVRQDNLLLASKVATLKTQLEQTEGTLRKKESEISQMDASKKDVMQALDETSKSLIKVTQERDAVTTSLRDLQMSLRRLSAERDSIANELKVATEARMELETQVLSASTVESANIGLARKLEDSVDSLAKVTNERDVMMVDYKTTLQKLADAETRIAVLSDELSKVKVSYNDAIHRHEEVASQLHDIVSNNSDTIHELEQKLDVSARDKDQMRKTFMVLNDRVAALSDEREENKSTIHELQESLAVAEADLVEAQQKYESKMADMEKIVSEIAQLNYSSDKQKDEIIHLKSLLKERDEENEVLRRDSMKAEESVERSTIEFTAYKRCMEERFSERQTVLCELQMFSETKQRELREKLATIQKSKDELVSQISDSLESFCNDFSESGMDCDASVQGESNWQQSLNRAKLLVSTLLDTERGRVSRLDAKLSDANIELQQAASEVAETSKELLETRQAMETLQRALSEKTELANSFLRERDDAHSRLVFLAGKLEEASLYKESKQDDVAELEALLIEHQGIASRLQFRTEQLEAKNVKLREYIRKLTAKCEEWQDSWNQQNRIILELQNQ